MADLKLRKKYYTGLQIIDAVKDLHLSYDDSLKLYKNLSETETADVVEVVHGEWINVSDEDWAGGGKTECCNCNYGYAWDAYFEVENFKYCPHCGAKMDGDGDG